MAMPLIQLPSDASPRVSILMLLTGPEAQARAALAALAAAHDGSVAAETILVLNAADEAVRALVLDGTAGARVVVSDQNLGTAGSWNRALARAAGEFIATVHEDAEVQPGWLAELVAVADAQPRAAAVGARLLHPDGTLQNSGWILLRDGRTAQVLEPPAGDDPLPVDLCSSATLLIERAALEAAGGFDEGFFPAVYVEIALCTAFWQAGRGVLSAPRARVVHRTAAMVAPGRGALASMTFRLWLIEHHRQRFCAQYAAALSGFEACDEPWPVPPEVVARGLERTRGRWEALTNAAGRPTPPPTPAPTPPADPEPVPAAEQAAFAAREQTVAREFLEWAVPRAEQREDELAAVIREAYGALDVHVARGRALERELAEAQARVAALEAEAVPLRAAAQTLDAVLAGRWWRLRTALRRAGRRPWRRRA